MIKKIKTIKKRYWVLVIVILVILLLVAFRKNAEGNITTYTVARQDVADAIELAGTIDVDRRVDLGFASAGRISDIYFFEGQEVKKGDVIAEIDQNQLEANLIQARASQVVTQADTLSESSTVSVDLATITAQQDELVDNAYKSYLSGDLQAYIDGNTSRSLVAPTISGTHFGDEGEYLIDVYSSDTPSGFSIRLSGLASGTYKGETDLPGNLGENGLYLQFSPDVNYRNTSWVVPVPNTRSNTYISRRAAYENALATREQVVSSALNNFNRVNASSLDVSRSDAQLQQARAQVNAVYAQLNDGKIRAPFDGIVARNNLEIGEIVSAYQPLVTLFGSDERELNLNVPEIYINKLESGDTVEVTLDAYPEESFTGTVRLIDIIDTLVDGVPVYETNVRIDQQDPRIRVGMNARGKVTSEVRENVLAIPKHYIVEEDDKTEVLLRENGDVINTAVEIGFQGNEGLVEILSGLKEGDEIVRPGESTGAFSK